MHNPPKLDDHSSKICHLQRGKVQNLDYSSSPMLECDDHYIYKNLQGKAVVTFIKDKNKNLIKNSHPNINQFIRTKMKYVISIIVNELNFSIKRKLF